MIAQDEFITNLLSRTATIATQDYDDNNLQVIFPTRKEHIIDFFHGASLDFQDFHQPTRTFQVSDILTNQVIKVNIDKLSLSLFGLPLDIAPPVIANPMFHTALSNKDLFDYHLPFLTVVKDLRDANKLINIISKNDRNIVDNFLSFMILMFNEYNYELHTENAISILCNKDLIEYAKTNLIAMPAYTVLKEVYESKKDAFNPKRVDDILNIIKDKELAKKLWKGYLFNKKDKLVEEYAQEKIQVLQELEQNNDSNNDLEKQFIEAQYTNVIDSLNKLSDEDIDIAFDILPENGFLFYIPNEIQPATTILNDTDAIFITSRDLSILKALKDNNFTFETSMINDFLIYRTNKTEYNIVFDDFLTYKYIQPLKEIRYKQVCEHAEKLANSIKEESIELDENDIKEITDLVLDFDTFKQQIDELTTVRDVLQYWPAVLLPSPSFVTYL